MPTLKEIQEFIENVSKLDLHRIDIKSQEYRLTVQFHGETDNQQIVSNYTSNLPIDNKTIPLQASFDNVTKQENKDDLSSIKNENITQSADLITIKSPMVGTFYRRSKPEHAAFVELGSKIKQGDVLCVIEAMKLFNEIESEISGEIVKILVNDGSAVEYDQPLFLVKVL